MGAVWYDLSLWADRWAFSGAGARGADCKGVLEQTSLGQILKDAYGLRRRGKGHREFGENPGLERCGRGLKTVWYVWENIGCH